MSESTIIHDNGVKRLLRLDFAQNIRMYIGAAIGLLLSLGVILNELLAGLTGLNDAMATSDPKMIGGALALLAMTIQNIGIRFAKRGPIAGNAKVP